MKPKINRDPTPSTSLLPRSHPPDNEVPRTSSIYGGFNVSTSMIGAGIISILATLKVLGIIPGFVVLLIMAYVGDVTVEFLSRYTDCTGEAKTYGGVMAKSFGKFGSFALQICVMVSKIGALIIVSVSYTLAIIHLIIVEITADKAPPLVDGTKFKLHTLPVDARAIADGDGLTVYVSAFDPRESSNVPHGVRTAFAERQEARGGRNQTKADALKKQIKDEGYNVLYINKKEILARKYRIRLRGIDAPENAMPYGKEAKDELVKIVKGKCLDIRIFDEDQYGRFVGDVYCAGIFVQEMMLKNGHAWHYALYDKRPGFAKWEKDARDRRIGLWASENPEMPWKWRKKHPQSRYST